MAEGNSMGTNPSSTESTKLQEVVDRPIQLLDHDGHEVRDPGQDTSVNEDTTKVVQKLTKERDKLSQELASLKQDQQKRNELLVTATKMVSEERQDKEEAVRMRQAAEERCEQLQNQLDAEQQIQRFLKQEIERLSPSGGSDETGSGPSMESLNQIQMLKQQISVYADDFAKERSNREIVQADRDALKERVKEYEKEMAVLNEQYERRVISKCDAGNQTTYQNTESGRSKECRALDATAVEPAQDNQELVNTGGFYLADRQLLKAALENKDAIFYESEQKRLDLEKLLKDTIEQLEKANESGRMAELKVEEMKRECAELKHKCDEFYWQATGLLIQQQEYADEINSLQLLSTDLVQHGVRSEERSRVINDVLLAMTRRTLGALLDLHGVEETQDSLE